MSLDPSLGHLYHDGNLNNVYSNLDVQDKMRTREINARETKYLEKYVHIMDRAKGYCKRRNEHEQRTLKAQLTDIKWKTPTLKSSLEQERQRLKRQRYLSRHSSDVKLPLVTSKEPMPGYDIFGDDSKRNMVIVSGRSIYSNDGGRHYSAPEPRSKLKSRESTLSHGRQLENSRSTRAPSYVRRSEQIATTLNKLFEQSNERKARESEKTVLDILGKGSKEELEKALFVLRGTKIGTVIEDILAHRRMLSQSTSDTNGKDASTSASSESSELASGDVGSFDVDDIKNALDENDSLDNDVTTLQEDQYVRTTLPPTETNMMYLNRSQDTLKRGSKLPRIFPKLPTENTQTELTNTFKRDQSTLSSLVANASDKSSVVKAGVNMKWTEIFKAPELWKQSQKSKNVSTSQKTLNIVTLTGKRRQTMMKR